MSKIEWTDVSWNPVRGCSRVSEGCRNCYAEKQAARFAGPGGPYEGLVKDGRWTGKVRLVSEKLEEPLHWRKPRRVFVNSMSDLFHESLTDEQIAAVFGVMAACPQHTFQVLTKRPERMLHVLSSWSSAGLTLREGCGVRLPNIWLGVSVEDQRTADERIPLLLQAPAAVRFVSAEPLLGPIQLDDLVIGDRSKGEQHFDALYCDVDPEDDEPCRGATLDWIIVGGESGPRARPCDVEWIRSIVGQCREAGVPCFVKQLGALAHTTNDDEFDQASSNNCVDLVFNDPKGGDPSEWPEDLRVREFPAERRK